MPWKNAKGGIVYWLNRFLNPDHPWTTYWDPTTGEEVPDTTLRGDSASYGIGSLESSSLFGTIGKGVEALINKWTDAGATAGEIERNQMQMQNAEDIYQRQVVGMQKAGLNPALMYGSGSGAGNAPSVNTAGAPGLSMSDVISAVLAKKQGKLIDSQIRNIDSDTNKKNSETEYQNLVNKYFPGMKSVELDKMLSEIGYNEEQIAKMKSEVRSIDLDAELKSIEKVIKHAEADESSAYFKAVREFQQASTDKVKQEKAKLVQETAMAVLEKEFMKNTNTKMGSAQVIAIAAGLGTLLHNAFDGSEGSAGWNPDKLTESLKADLEKLMEWINKPKTLF